jgi:hypothetical protein
MSRKLGIVFAIVLMNLLAGAMVLMGQDTPPSQPTRETFTSAATFNNRAQLGQTAVIEGTLTWIIGDPQSALEPMRFTATVWDDQGQPIARLTEIDGSAYTYYLDRVQVTGLVSSLATSRVPTTLSVTSMREVAPGTSISSTGPQPFANIACAFSDVPARPKTIPQYQTMFGNTYPNLDHYFRDMSYNAINLTGSFTVGYFNIGPIDNYFFDPGIYDNPDLGLIAQDCAEAADAAINYATVVGINILLNDNLGCCAYGGSFSYTNLDGANRTIRTTWDPPWAQEYDVIGHEMGHAFGMPHSTGPSGSPPSGLGVYVSAWDVMSDAGGNRSYRPCAEFSNLYGCTAQGMIAAQLLYPDWMPAADKAFVNRGFSQSVLLERLRNQPVGSDDLIALIPTLSNSSLADDYYTVEVRENVGYDQNNMVQLVGGTWTTLIHFVDTNRSFQNGQPLIVTAGNSTAINGPAAMWQAGESFRDTTRNVTINIIAREGNAVRVNIGNNTARPTNDAFSSATVVSAFPFNATPDTLLATQETADPTLTCLGNQKGYYTVWYRHTSTSNQTIILNTEASLYDTALGVFSGSPGTLTEIACNDNDTTPQARLEFYAQSGVTYYFVLASPTSSVFGPASLNIASTPASPVSTRFTTTSPTLTWNAVSGIGVTYELQVSAEASFSPLAYAANSIAGLSHTVGAALFDGTYYWRVRARFGNGTFSGWSTVGTFSIDVP